MNHISNCSINRSKKAASILHCWGGHGLRRARLSLAFDSPGLAAAKAIDALAQFVRMPPHHYPFEGEQESIVLLERVDYCDVTKQNYSPI